jgi:hypothetical protein
MNVSELPVIGAKLAILLAVAILAGVAVFFACALVGREVLMWRYGENLAGIDDTLPMILAVRTSVLVSVASAVLVLAATSWRFLLRPARPDERTRESPRN